MGKINITVKREGQKVTLIGERIQSRFFDTEAEAIECYNTVKTQINEAEKQS